MRDPTVPVRRATLIALQGEPSITDLIPATNIYPPRTTAKPVWPFIRYGQATWTPINATRVGPSTITVAIHVYANGGDEVAGAAVAAIAAFLYGKHNLGRSLALADGSSITVLPQQSQVIQDGEESNSWHGFVTLRILVAN